MKKAILLNDTSNEMHHGCNLVIKSIKKLLKKNNINLIYTILSGSNWKEDFFFKKKIENKEVDIIIVNGEGTIHHNQENGQLLVEVSKFAKENSVISVLINCTFSSNDSFYKVYLKNFSMISVRENKSKQELKLLGIDSKVVPDLSFYNDKYITNNNKKNILIGDSVIPKITNYLLNFSIKNKYKFIPILTFYKIRLNKMKTFFGFFKFIILNIILRVNQSSNYSNYYLRFYGTYFTDSYFKIINSSKLLITGRYHSICIAIICRTPFISISSNTFKIEELLKDIGLNQKRNNLNLDELNKSIKMFQKFYNYEEYEIKNIKMFLNRTKKVLKIYLLK